jgi:hypothetical protein
MARMAVLIGALLLAALPASASNAVSLGYSEQTTIIGPDRECSGGTLFHNHDGSFESAYTWQYEGCQSPYFGALGEAYDLGAGTISCAALWLTDLADYIFFPDNADCYLWDGGVSTDPGGVLALVPNVHMPSLPYWPTVRQYDVDMNIAVSGPVTVGCWGPWPYETWWWYCAADLDGPPGHPWTCIAPGIGYPSGWQDPSIVWGPTSAMGCGVYFEQGTPVESETWGAVKALFRQ